MVSGFGLYDSTYRRVMVSHNRVYINYRLIREIEIKGNSIKIYEKGNKLYINGFENKKGKWQKTLKAKLFCMFG